MKTTTQITYEVYLKGWHGAKLAETFTAQDEAVQAIKEARQQQIDAGYKPDNYYIVLCMHTITRDDDGDMISESTTRCRLD